MTQKELGNMLGVAENTICEILKDAGVENKRKIKTRELRKNIREALLRGDKPLAHIAKELGTDETTVRDEMHKAALHNKHFALRMKEVEVRNRRLINLYAKGKNTIKEVATAFAISKGAVYAIFEENEVDTNREVWHRGKYRNWCKDMFDAGCLSPYAAYIVGLVSADGYISDYCVSITLTEKDKYLLEHVGRCVLNARPSLVYRPAQLQVWPDGIERLSKPTYTLNLSRKRLADQFKYLGLHQAKSKTCPFLTLDQDLMPYYVLGCFDGDGWVYGSRTGIVIGFTGSEQFIRGVSAWLRAKIGGSWTPHNTKSCWVCVCSAKLVVRRFAAMVYTVPVFCLSRKRNTLESLILLESLSTRA